MSKEITVSSLKEKAISGDAESQYQLGAIYYDEESAEQNFPEAKRFFEMAAAQDHPRAIVALGDMYEAGFGVKTDFIKALEYYTKAVSLNSDEAKETIRVMYDALSEEVNDFAENFAQSVQNPRFEQVLAAQRAVSNYYSNEIAKARASGAAAKPSEM